MRSIWWVLAVSVLAILATAACSRRENVSVKENVEQALKQGGYDNINVDENREKGVVTLKGEVKTEDDKARAAQLVQQAAAGRVVANEIAVRPEGMEGVAKDIQSNTDDAIESHWKATVAANKWENQDINAEVNNGVLTLKGEVDTTAQRSAVEKAAAAVPGVQQVVNELSVKGQKKPAAKGGS
ncbi:MAG TPA: BON domain-containing protein [Terriglobales bacterium]|nr:BON domain-containing protein [Terriglobales bacterium]